MTPDEYLRRTPEAMPRWLEDFEAGNVFPREQFFASRIVYYPGSGTDGQPVELFGSTHSAHSFLYVDYGVPQAAIEADLDHAARRFRGYHTLARIQLAERDLNHNQWVQHADFGESAGNRNRYGGTPPFGFLEVLERDHGLDDDHGARRFAVIFLGADGIAAYDALFCQKQFAVKPFALVIQDHGFGGNYDKYGQGGLLWRIANQCDALPQFLWVAENSRAWNGYIRIPGVDGVRGGLHATPRFLYERRD